MTITVLRAPPYLTVQDLGRVSFREAGVPRAGAMDRFALAAANAVLGNPAEAAGFEWALGGGALRFESDTAFTIAAVELDATINGKPVAPFSVVRANAVDELEIGTSKSGRFLYLAFDGGLATEILLGSRSTYLPARFGGIDGRSIRSGQSIALGPQHGAPRDTFTAPSDLRPDYARRTIRVVPGPQWKLFAEKDRARFLRQTYTVSRVSDRMGYRLDGEPLSAPPGLLPSEAVCEGAIQIPPEGLPIVLMADAPTVGGYPKIAVVATADLPILAQLNPGESFRFEQTTMEDAQRLLRRSAASLHTIFALAARH